MTEGQSSAFASQIPGWAVVENRRIEKGFEFRSFKAALDFVNSVGLLAEEQGHHPDICFGWGRVRISVSTHMIEGLTEMDFILAAKIDRF